MKESPESMGFPAVAGPVKLSKAQKKAQKEAAAFSLPAVFVQGATTASQVRDGENGFLVANDAGAFSARVLALMDAPATIRRAGEGAFRTLHRSWEQVVDEVVLRYRAIIERYARASSAA